MRRILDRRIDVGLIFGAVAVAVATSATIRYLKELSSWVCLSEEEVADVIDFYRHLEESALNYLHSDTIAGSRSIHDISTYMADRTAEAGKVAMLHHHIDQGIGDEKTMLLLIDRLIGEKNEARKGILRSCGDEMV